MKNILFLLGAWLGTSFFLAGQSIPNPEFSMRPYFIDQNGEIKNLERSSAQADYKVGLGGTEIYYTVFPGNSSVRFMKGNIPKLVIKVEGNIDPSDVISLAQGEKKGKRRRFLQSSMKPMGKTRNISKQYVNAAFKRLDTSVYEILLPETLQAGEYAFIPVNSAGTLNPVAAPKIMLICFGLDPAPGERK
jgi:hypothetical protein